MLTGLHCAGQQANADTYRALIQDGVFIERLRIGSNNKAIGGWERITSDTVTAWSREQFEKRVNERDTALLIIAQSIYGKSEYPAGINIIELAKMQQMERENRLLTINLYASLTNEAAQAAGLFLRTSLWLIQRKITCIKSIRQLLNQTLPCLIQVMFLLLVSI